MEKSIIKVQGIIKGEEGVIEDVEKRDGEDLICLSQSKFFTLCFPFS